MILLNDKHEFVFHIALIADLKIDVVCHQLHSAGFEFEGGRFLLKQQQQEQINQFKRRQHFCVGGNLEVFPVEKS
jgi:hypothetical protein